MDARTPEKLHPLWVQAHNMGDLDGMMVLCEPEVCFVTWSGRSVAGTDAVREAYRTILETKPRMELAPPSLRSSRCPPVACYVTMASAGCRAARGEIV